MSNEMISVPRDKLTILIAQCLDDAEGNPDIILEELRTLLSQPELDMSLCDICVTPSKKFNHPLLVEAWCRGVDDTIAAVAAAESGTTIERLIAQCLERDATITQMDKVGSARIAELEAELVEKDALLREVINGKSRIQFDGNLMHRILMAISNGDLESKP